jgi:hypothetical protein
VARVSPPESPAPAATTLVSATALAGVNAIDMPGLRLSETAWSLVLSVAGGMTLETNLSIAW